MNPSHQRILVTGACGFIGSHTVEHLLNQGHQVLAIDNLRTGNRDNLSSVAEHPSLQTEIFSVCERDRLESVAAEFEPNAIIHLAALVSVQESIDNPEDNYQLNLANTHSICEVARKHDVKRVVFASSAAIFGNPIQLPIDENHPKAPLSPYGMGKWVSEQILDQYRMHYGIDTYALRFFNVYGPRQDPSSPYSGVISIFSDRISANQSLTVFGDGLQTRDFIYVKDVAAIISNAATARDVPSGPYNICTGKETTLNQLIETLGRITNTSPETNYEAPREGDIIESLGSNEKLIANKLFSGLFMPLEDGLRNLLA